LLPAVVSLIGVMPAGARADPRPREARMTLPHRPAEAPAMCVLVCRDPHFGTLATDRA